MRRRERWAGITWVQWMEGDSPEGARPNPESEPMKHGAALYALTHDYRRYVEIARDHDAYTVRVLPRDRSGESWDLDVGLSYMGTCLSSILTCAVVDLDLLGNKQARHRAGAKERQRWVG